MNRAFTGTHFQVNFYIFSDKNNHDSNIRRNMFDVKKLKYQGCGSGPFWSDPENFHRIRILSVQGKNILKIPVELLHIFR